MVPAALPWRLIRFRVGKHCELRYQSPNATTNEERGRRCGPSAPRIPVLAAWECESVTLIAIFEPCAPPWIAGINRGDMGFEQVVQPSRTGSFFKGQIEASACPGLLLPGSSGDNLMAGFGDRCGHRQTERPRPRGLSPTARQE